MSKSPRRPLIISAAEPKIEPDKHGNIPEKIDGDINKSEENGLKKHDTDNIPATGAHVQADIQPRSLVRTVCDQFATWEFFTKCADVLEKNYKKIRDSTGIDFKDLPSVKKLVLLEDIVARLLFPPQAASALKHGGPGPAKPVRTVSEVLEDVRRARTEQHATPVASEKARKVGFRLNAEEGPTAGGCLDFQTFFECIRRLAERLDRSQLMALFVRKPPGPAAARWSALPSVVSWNLRGSAGAAQLPAQKGTADPPPTPWTKAHRKSALRPRTSVRRLLAQQDQMRQAHMHKVLELESRARAEAQQQRRRLASQKEKVRLVGCSLERDGSRLLFHGRPLRRIGSLAGPCVGESRGFGATLG